MSVENENQRNNTNADQKIILFCLFQSTTLLLNSLIIRGKNQSEKDWNFDLKCLENWGEK